jgi:hypothetical protein
LTLVEAHLEVGLNAVLDSYSVNCDQQFSYRMPDKMPGKTSAFSEGGRLLRAGNTGRRRAVSRRRVCGGFHDQYSPPVFDQYRKQLVEARFVVANVDFTEGHDIAAPPP